jgi:hypothetical protein
MSFASRIIGIHSARYVQVSLKSEMMLHLTREFIVATAPTKVA